MYEGSRPLYAEDTRATNAVDRPFQPLGLTLNQSQEYLRTAHAYVDRIEDFLQPSPKNQPTAPGADTVRSQQGAQEQSSEIAARLEQLNERLDRITCRLGV